jgi:hypothetical protein
VQIHGKNSAINGRIKKLFTKSSWKFHIILSVFGYNESVGLTDPKMRGIFGKNYFSRGEFT